MLTVRKSAGVGTAGRWLVATCAMSLWLAPYAAVAQQQQTPPVVSPTTPDTTTGTTAAVDIQSLNRSLQVERTLAQFFTVNADKAYLSATGVTTPDTGTGTTPDTGTGTPPTVDAGAGNTLTATLSGGQEVPPVDTSATGTATFTFNQDRTQLAYDVRVSGLSGPATAMHIHRGAPGVAGPIVYPLNTPDASGVATGSTAINATDVDGLMQGEFYLNVHTAANPPGEIRGQVLAAAQPAPGTPTDTTPGTTPGVTPVGLDALRGMVTEMRTAHNAHVATLEQALGTNVQPVPTFQNLDAPTLQQFLTMAQTLEDFAVSAHQGVIQAWVTSGTGLADPSTATQPGSAQSLLSTIAAIAIADARFAGAIRAYRKTASTAEGGDPNLTLTEDGGAQNIARDAAQVDQFLQQYIVATGTTPAPGTTQPTNGGTTQPTNGGTTPPTNGGTTPPTNGGTTPPTNGGTPAAGGTY